ncbi:SOS response-associated peptidase [Cyclobacterium plantarum]|uniref:Abasic site processing protein n=1 Tax=Cyclobacterium plantarum TaxID=2716263 RepID=A0ABX0H5G0_9BACT|nr:SOS response-associated peptidase [Cyclobacterium plantarum]NHE55608.1 SOS response-associated peptidase [Cyclobacterium plantarum]
MCGRYSLAKTKIDLENRFEAEMLEAFTPRYNIAPSQLVPVITTESPKGFSHFYWGITPSFAKNKPVANKLINARAETITEKATFKNAFKKNRCLVPADGFYEWKKIGKKTKVPYRFVLHGESIFSMAGIWEEYETEKGETAHTFLVLTTAPNQLSAEIHDRMPVILKKEDEAKWLDVRTQEEELLGMLGPYPDDEMTKYTVSPMVNQVANDSAYVIRKTLPMDQFGNYTLFG